MKTKILIILIILSFALVSFVEAAQTREFFDDFESGADKWSLTSGWSVVLDGDNNVLEGTEHTFVAANVGGGTVKKLELKLKLLKGGIHLNMRSRVESEGHYRYFIGLKQGDSYIQKQTGQNFYVLRGGGRGISLNRWHDVSIEMAEDMINVFVDGRLHISASDKEMLTRGGISFETLENSRAYIDDVRVETIVPEAREIKAQDLFPDGEHKGDITLSGEDFLILEDGKFEQFGNIFLKDNSKLVIRNSTLKITRYERLLNHWRIIMEDYASLEAENSKLLPGWETLLVIEGRNWSKVSLKNSPTEIHLFEMHGNSRAIVEGSEIVGEIGGLVSAYDKADVKIIDSKIGAINLYIPHGATFEVEGLRTGLFEKWSLQEDTKVERINSNITLINTELVKDTIGTGPFERSWPIFIESDANVKIKNSEVRKIVLHLYDEDAEFTGLAADKAANFNYRNINLENVVVSGQWGIFPHGSSDVVVRDSEDFWTFIYDDAKLTLINTHMDEFDPRDFFGEIIFKNVRWDTAAEIIENNDFTMRGTLKIGNIGGFSWEDSKVTRIYDVIGEPNSALTLKKNEEVVWQGAVDEEGNATFSIKFDDQTFDELWNLEDSLERDIKVSFFSNTPIRMNKSWISKITDEIKYGTPPLDMRLVVPIIFIAAIMAFFFWRKYLRKK